MIYLKIQDNLTPIIVEVGAEKDYKIGSSISVKRKNLTAIQSHRLSTGH